MRVWAVICGLAATGFLLGGMSVLADGQAHGYGWIVAGCFAYFEACSQWRLADQASGLEVIREELAVSPEQTDAADPNIEPCHIGCLEHGVEEYFGAINRVRQPAIDLLVLNKKAGFSDEASERMAMHHFYECIDHVRSLPCRDPFQSDGGGEDTE